jgi:hypothetical protein
VLVLTLWWATQPSSKPAGATVEPAGSPPGTTAPRSGGEGMPSRALSPVATLPGASPVAPPSTAKAPAEGPTEAPAEVGPGTVDRSTAAAVAAAAPRGKGAAPAPGAQPSPGAAGSDQDSPVKPSVDVVGEDAEHEHEHASVNAWRAPLSSKCKGERGYLAGAVAFPEPTPARLAEALGEVSRGGLAVSIQARGDDLRVALSAAEPRGAGQHGFPVGAVPPFLRLVDGFGEPPGISSERFQSTGFLRVSGASSTSLLKLRRVNWRATESDDCGELQVDGFAEVPPDQWDVPLPLAAGPRAIRALLDPEFLAPPEASPGVAPARAPAGLLPVPLHFSFKASSVVIARQPL